MKLFFLQSFLLTEYKLELLFIPFKFKNIWTANIFLCPVKYLQYNSHH